MWKVLGTRITPPMSVQRLQRCIWRCSGSQMLWTYNQSQIPFLSQRPHFNKFLCFVLTRAALFELNQLPFALVLHQISPFHSLLKASFIYIIFLYFLWCNIFSLPTMCFIAPYICYTLYLEFLFSFCVVSEIKQGTHS